MKDNRVDFIQCQRILQEIREDLSADYAVSPSSTSYDILNAIRIKRFDRTINGDWQITIDVCGVNDCFINIDEKHISDKDFIKFQIAGEIARIIEIVGFCIKNITSCIFPYQNKLVKDWENKTKERRKNESLCD